MKSYALVGYFDEGIERKIYDIWDELNSNGISNYGVACKNKRPHITIADYFDIDEDMLINEIKKRYKDVTKVEVSFNQIGTFIQSQTLYFAPVLTDQLFKLHRDHHDYFGRFDLKSSKYYLPNNWIPHTTIASRLSQPKAIETIEYCNKLKASLEGYITSIGLIYIEENSEGIAIQDKIILDVDLK